MREKRAAVKKSGKRCGGKEEPEAPWSYIHSACDGRKRCGMRLRSMEKMGKKHVMAKEVQRNTVKRMTRRTNIVKQANKRKHFPQLPPKKLQLNKS